MAILIENEVIWTSDLELVCYKLQGSLGIFIIALPLAKLTELCCLV